MCCTVFPLIVKIKPAGKKHFDGCQIKAWGPIVWSPIFQNQMNK